MNAPNASLPSPASADPAPPVLQTISSAPAEQLVPSGDINKPLAQGLLGEPPKSDSDAVKLTRGFWIRVVLCLFIAVLSTWWIIHYTDLFELVGSLLGLTGVFALLGIVFKIVPTDRMEKIQEITSRWLWDSHSAPWVLVVLLICFTVLTMLFGTLQLESVQGEFLVSIERVRTPTDKCDEAERVPANGRLRVVKLASWLAGDYRVRASGLPEQTMAANPWRRQDRQLPHSFLRPIVLIWPDDSLIKILMRDKPPASLYVVVDEVGYFTECRGESIWVGYQGDMMVPKYVRDFWQAYQNEPAVLGNLLQPRSLTEAPISQAGQTIPGTSYKVSHQSPPRELKSGQRIQGILVRQGGSEADASTPRYTVRSVRESTDVVQALPLLSKKP